MWYTLSVEKAIFGLRFIARNGKIYSDRCRLRKEGSMKFGILALVGLLLVATVAAHGAQRVVLVEQFTNSGCPACNSIKDTMVVVFQDLIDQAKIVPILYHTWWPYPSDPFYLFNPQEDSLRTMYYAGFEPWIEYLYVPSFRFDGKYIKDPSDFATIQEWVDFFYQTVDSLVTIPSPLRIKITDNTFSPDSDSVYVSFDVVADDDASFNMILYLAVTEWRHRYSYPVGKHDHAFRDFVPDANGYSIPGGMSAGDSLHFDWSYYVDPEYRTDRLVTNIFIQRSGTRKIQQAVRQEPSAYAGVEITGGDVCVKLEKNVPNPFTSKTTISFSLARPGKVELGIYTLTGRLVTTLVDHQVDAGSHKVTWDGRDRFGNEVGSGVYYYKVRTASETRSGKMILLR